MVFFPFLRIFQLIRSDFLPSLLWSQIRAPTKSQGLHRTRNA
jgi:hypothetical protein